MSSATAHSATCGPAPPGAADRDYILADQRLMAAAPHYFAWQARLVLPYLGRRVLEVGCGTGNFTSHLADRELVVAVDHEPACLATLARRYPERASLRLAAADLANDSFLDLARFRPDSCVCLNVLEHLPNDAAALRRLAAVLPSGGVIALIVPALPALLGTIDARLGHHRRYTRASLRRLAAAAGLSVRHLRHWNALGALGWWVNARLLRRERQSATQIALFDRLVAPSLERLERLLPPPFGQSLLAILARPLSSS